MTPKQTYSLYIADDTLSPLSYALIEEIRKENPLIVLDYGAGSGKHCNILQKAGIETICVDISMMNIVRAHAKYELPNLICSDERILKVIKDVDVLFTCSCMDHIEKIDMIIDEFKRIARVVILAETQDTPGEFYFNHDYESYGFKKVRESIEVTCKDSAGSEYLNGEIYSWTSEPPEGDGATYHIWKWVKGQKENGHANDDLCAV
jgi:ubiquinone/menaquinone biosynthesis C-methylase UbiE